MADEPRVEREHLKEAADHAAAQGRTLEWDPLGVIDVSVVVSDSGADDRVVGLILDHDGTEIIGAVPNTPAEKIGLRRASMITRLPVNHERVQEIEQMKTVRDWIDRRLMQYPVDGRWRPIGVAYCVAALRRDEGVPHDAALDEFDRNMTRFDRWYRDLVVAKTGREPTPVRRAGVRGDDSLFPFTVDDDTLIIDDDGSDSVTVRRPRR